MDKRTRKIPYAAALVLLVLLEIGGRVVRIDAVWFPMAETILTRLIGALVFAYGRLRDIWEEQCVITDYASQVSITDGRMVRADVIAGQFGIKNGANLAAIDFERRRREIMEKIPNIRNIRITRHLPNRVEIDVEERVPVARLGIKGRNDASGRVVDTDGVVFISSSGTQMLPTIREGAAPGTQKEVLHLQTYDALFPYVKAFVSSFTANAGIPPIFIPYIDISDKNIYRVEMPRGNG